MYSVDDDCLQKIVKNKYCSRLYSIKRMDRGPQFTRGASPIRISSMLGEQITVGQLTNKEGMTMHIHDMISIVRFNWALRQST